MSFESSKISIAVRRYSVLTCLVALLPISIGSVVTTLKAGMAFADWPTSDGQNMLLYPWLNDLRNTDRFVEHGHRLAGMLIGFVSIGLVIVAFLKEQRLWVRAFAIAILVAVIGQGLLGGMRVRMNAQVLAMTHSITGGLFFSMCFVFAVLVHQTPHRVRSESDDRVPVFAVGLAMLFPAIVLAQYTLGGFFRHLGTMLHEHVAGAILVLVSGAILIFYVRRSELPSVRRRGLWVSAALLTQVGLGLGSWITKLGLPSAGWVAVVNSPAQNVVCSLHTIGGMFLLATSVALAVECGFCLRAGWFRRLTGGISTVSSQEGLA